MCTRTYKNIYYIYWGAKIYIIFIGGRGFLWEALCHLHQLTSNSSADANWDVFWHLVVTKEGIQRHRSIFPAQSNWVTGGPLIIVSRPVDCTVRLGNSAPSMLSSASRTGQSAESPRKGREKLTLCGPANGHG